MAPHGIVDNKIHSFIRKGFEQVNIGIKRRENLGRKHTHKLLGNYVKTATQEIDY